MRRVATLLSAAAVVLFLANVSAQGKTDFSGKWAPDAEKNAAAAPAGGGGGGRGGNRGGGGGGGTMTITQDAKTLSIAREGRQGGAAPAAQVYNLDGSDSKITMGQNEVTANAKWDGAKLVITTKTANGDSVSTYSIDGGELVIERTVGGNAVKTYYKKGA
jgi:hypothetical protein